jgi:hypothetical protein
MEYLRATRDDEMGKIGPTPTGCGAIRSILVAVATHHRLWTRHSLRIPPRLHPTDEDLSAGAPVLDRFSSAIRGPQRTNFARWGGMPPTRKLIAGSSILLIMD